MKRKRLATARTTLMKMAVTSDGNWALILEELRASLRFLSGSNQTVTVDAEGRTVIDPDADLRNANWPRIAAANRLAGHHLPTWAAMWLWRVGHERDKVLWLHILDRATRFGCEGYEPSNA